MVKSYDSEDWFQTVDLLADMIAENLTLGAPRGDTYKSWVNYEINGTMIWFKNKLMDRKDEIIQSATERCKMM